MVQSVLLTTDVLTFQSRSACPRLKKYTEVSIFLFGFLCLIVPSGYSYGSVLLLLGGIYVLIKDRGFLPIDRYDKYILWALLIFGLGGIFDWLWHGFDGDIDKSIRFIFAIPIFYLVYRARPSLHALWLGLVFGVLGACVFAFYQKFFLAIPRSEGFTNAIQFGNLAMLQGLLCLAGLGWATSLKTHRRKYIFLLGIAAVAGIVTSALSGTRGGWIGLPIILLVVFFAYRRLFSLRSQLLLFLILIVGGSYLISNPQIGVKKRIAEAVHQVSLFQDGKVDTSVGMRLEMWRGAYKLVQEKPFFGWGKEGYQQGMQELSDKGELHVRAGDFGHAHNEFIDRFAKHGLIGFLALLCLYLLPIRTFSVAKNYSDLSIKAVGLAGTLLALCYIDFGMTQAFFRHNSGVMVYATLLAVIAGYFKVQRLSSPQLKS